MKGKWLAIGSVILSMAMHGSVFAEDKDKRTTRKTKELPVCTCVADTQKKTCRQVPPKDSKSGCRRVEGACVWPKC